jgi:hypothetical protein
MWKSIKKYSISLKKKILKFPKNLITEYKQKSLQVPQVLNNIIYYIVWVVQFIIKYLIL